MIDLALIPARGGSKGLPGKNILELGGVPLIAWTIRAAIASELCQKVVVSTDDEGIAEVARSWGALVPFLRPLELSHDTATSADVVLHALDELQPDGVVALLQPTSPFRNARHLRESVELLKRSGAQGVISVAHGKPLAWAHHVVDELLVPAVEDVDGTTRRQDHRTVFYPNGAIYCAASNAMREAGGIVRAQAAAYEMSAIDSLDIDDEADLDLARAIVDTGLRSVDA